MIRHTLTLIYRSCKRFKSIFFINLIGLASGLGCSLLIYLWVQDELSIDKFHQQGERIYYAWEHRVKADGIWTSRNTSSPLAQSLIDEMPEVEYACAATRPQPATLSIGDTDVKVSGRYVGKDFFRIFSYELLAGNEDKMLHDIQSIVISDALALRLFGSVEESLGKMIEREHKEQFMVTGIFKEVPGLSSEQFEFVMSFENFESRNNWVKGWGSTGTATYVLLKDGTDVNSFNKKISNYVTVKTNYETKHRTLFLKKYSDMYLYGEYQNGVQAGGRITYVKLFSVIAIFILIIACINFMNLSTAKSTQRIKEVGIKKAMGAPRFLLMMHYLGESIIMSYMSLALAILLVDICMDPFNAITGKHLSLHFTPKLAITLLIFGLVTGILAGSYPCIYLSGFRPATILKGRLNTGFGELWARKGLVVFQFALSVILIISVLIIYKQIEFVQSANLGYQRDNVLFFYREGITESKEGLETMLAELKRIPGVINASNTSHGFNGHSNGTSGIIWPGKDAEDRTEFENLAVNYDLLETLGLQMASGRMFARNNTGDTSKLIINETGAKFMGIKDPIGLQVKLWGMDMQIIGIVKDFHYESLHENYKPAFFRLDPNDGERIMVKLEAKNQKETIGLIERLYKKLNPKFAFDYSFLDTQYQSQYVAEQRVSVLSRYFAGLAILISCLGLFGLAAFTAERRIKEIGIRKVLGSTELGIVYLLSSEFTKSVVVAIAIALPLSYLLSKAWLNTFAFRTPLKVQYFIYGGIAALLIAWSTVAIQAFKAARVNPSKCLKEE